MLTELEKQVLLAIITSEYQPETDGCTANLKDEDVVEQQIWSLIHGNVQHLKGFENHKTISGVMASVVKKGFAGVFDATEIGGEALDNTCWITQKGYEAVEEFIQK